MVNSDYELFISFSRLYMNLFRHQTCTYLHRRADIFLVSVSSGQVAALGVLSTGIDILNMSMSTGFDLTKA